MSTQGQITDFLRSVKPEDGVIALTPSTLAMQTGIAEQKLRKTLYSLKQQGKIDFTKDERGREINGIKVIDLEPGKPGRKPGVATKHERMRLVSPKAVSGVSRRRGGVQTPNIDQYAKAKETFATLANQWGQWGSAEFHENPIAEEAMAIRDRLYAMEEQFIALRHEHDDLQRDYSALQAKKRTNLAKKAEANGAMAISAVD